MYIYIHIYLSISAYLHIYMYIYIYIYIHIFSSSETCRHPITPRQSSKCVCGYFNWIHPLVRAFVFKTSTTSVQR